MCLSGTSEIAIASFLSSKVFDYDSLPKKFCAISRCYRAEANKHQKERGLFRYINVCWNNITFESKKCWSLHFHNVLILVIYLHMTFWKALTNFILLNYKTYVSLLSFRVHQFTKVEMFGITANETGNESEELLDELTKIQEEIFSELGLYFRILEMPPCDTGLPAYHKYDMEAWIPTQKLFGEISSASNCTDYQSRRLNIRYLSPSNEHRFCHTVNGTAVAIPRLLITILENFQNLDGSITIPKPLQEHFKKDAIKDKFSETMLCTKLTK